MSTNINKEKRDRRHKRIRARVFGTASKPRLSVFRSNKFITLQLIDDEKGRTIAYTRADKSKAHDVGKRLAADALSKNIKKVVFDRSGFIYTGSVARAADGAREGGLKF